MSTWDKKYCELLTKIINNGVEVANRTGVNSVKIPSWHFSLDLGLEFPILTTKQVFIRQAVLEMRLQDKRFTRALEKNGRTQ